MRKEYIKTFREVLRSFDREVFLQNSASCCNGISLAQCITLLEIERKSEISVSELANSLSLDKSTVSRTIDGLVNINMVDRVTPKENFHLALAKLTDSGKQICTSINYTHDAFIRQVMFDFSEEEREVFLKLFRRLTNNMIGYREQKG